MAEAITALLSALAELFGVMFIGFLVFRLKLLEQRDMKGVGFLLGRIALPALLFSIVATVDYENIEWGLVGCVTLARILLMVTSFMVSAAASEGGERWMIAASAATSMQSNDSAFGVPLVMALYPAEKYGSQYLDLLTAILAAWTLVSPLQILMWEMASAMRETAGNTESKTEMRDALTSGQGLPPIDERPQTVDSLQVTVSDEASGSTPTAESLVLASLRAEEGTVVRTTTEQAEAMIRVTKDSMPSTDVASAMTLQPLEPQGGGVRQSFVVKLLKSMFQNPVILSTLAGLFYRFAFASTLTQTPGGYELPSGLKEIVDTIKVSFTFIALFALGESIEHNVEALKRPGGLRLPFFLCVVKLVVSPVLMNAMVSASSSKTGKDLSDLQSFAAMYGLLPTSEAVLVWERLYKKSSSADSASTVFLTTVLCGPLIFLANVYMQQLSATEYEVAFRSMCLTLTSLALVTTALFLFTFVLMGHRWVSCPPLRIHLSLAVVLCTYYVTNLVMYAGTDDNGSEICSSADPGARIFYVIHQGARLSSDFHICGMALGVGFFRRLRPELRKLTMNATPAVGILLAFGIYIVLELVQDPSSGHKGVTTCYNTLPAEEWLDPILRGTCTLVVIISLLLGLGTQRDEADDAIMARIGQPKEAGAGQTIYTLCLLASCSWVVQFISGVSQATQLEEKGVESATETFLNFVSAAIYMWYSPVQCLLLTLRGEPLNRWRALVARSWPCFK